MSAVWNVVDSSCWIEYFIASKRAILFKSIIEDSAKLIVPAISLFEVHRFLSRNATEQQCHDALSIMRRSQTIPLTDTRAIAASKTAQAHQLAMADAVMYAIAVEFNAQFWTQDVDYKGLPLVQYSVKSL